MAPLEKHNTEVGYIHSSTSTSIEAKHNLLLYTKTFTDDQMITDTHTSLNQHDCQEVPVIN